MVARKKAILVLLCIAVLFCTLPATGCKERKTMLKQMPADCITYIRNREFLPSGSKLSDANPVDRRTAAVICINMLGLKEGNTLPSDIEPGDRDAGVIKAACDLRLFGTAADDYCFEPDKALTRLDAARMGIRLYAAAAGIEDYNVEPGKPCGITDLTGINVEKQWYVYAAINLGLMGTIEEGIFAPEAPLTGGEFARLVTAVILDLNRRGEIETQASQQVRDEKFRIFPSVNKEPVEKIDVFNLTSSAIRKEERLAATSLQGLVNRDGPAIYCYIDNSISGGNRWMLKHYKDKGYIKDIGEEFKDVYSLIKKYRDKVKGAVIYDPPRGYTVNIATQIAAIEDRIIISPQMEEKIRGLGITDIKDIRQLGLTDILAASQWAYENLWPFLRRDVINWSYYASSRDFDRDYAVQMKIPTIWLPGSKDADYVDGIKDYVKEMLSKMPPNIPIFGFQYDTNDRGEEVGAGEYMGVRIAGTYAKYTNVSTHAGNYSFNTAIRVEPESLKSRNVEKTDMRFNPEKKYIAVTMIESGDSPGYIQYGFKYFQWDNKGRGDVAYNYSLGLANYDLMPGVIQYFFETSTPKDYFFGAISGLGYMYPLEKYGAMALFDDDGISYTDETRIIKDYYRKSDIYYGRLGFDAMGIYSHPGAFWKEEDYVLLREKIAPEMTHIKTIMADMGRVSKDALTKPVFQVNDRQTAFHSVTFWSTEKLGNGNDKINDPRAIDFQVKEIVDNTVTGNFFHCMSYSWHFGPRRIKLVEEELEKRYPGKYKFVTIAELQELYDQANKK